MKQFNISITDNDGTLKIEGSGENFTHVEILGHLVIALLEIGAQELRQREIGNEENDNGS